LFELTDVNDIIAIYNPLIQDCPFLYESRQRTPIDQLQRFQNLHNQGYPVWVLEQVSAKKVIGFAFLSPFRPQSGYAITAEHSIYLHADFQGQGLGLRLFDQLESSARALHIKNLVGVIDAKHLQSQAFHQKRGFNKVGTMPNIAQKNGDLLSVEYWLKAID
jgi:phosphinothricin acetyltransferase